MPMLRRSQAIAGLAALCVAVLPVSGALAAPPAKHLPTNPTKLANLRGQQLVHKFFVLLRTDDNHALANFLAPGFQIQRATGTHLNKRQYLAKHSKVVSFRISNLHVTSAPHLIITTYNVMARQYIDGVIYKQTPQARLSVFEQIRGQWYIVAHAFFSTPAA